MKKVTDLDLVRGEQCEDEHEGIAVFVGRYRGLLWVSWNPATYTATCRAFDLLVALDGETDPAERARIRATFRTG